MVDPIEILNAAGGERLAVVGLGLDFPGCKDLEGFLQAVVMGTAVSEWSGCWEYKGSLARAAAAAWQDAGWNGPRQPAEVGWLMVGPGSQTDAARAITTIHGPTMDFGGYGEPLPGMLIQAHDWLESHQVDSVLLTGSTEALESGGTLSFGFDQAAHSNPTGSGSIVIALMRLDQAVLRKTRIYAVIEGMAFHSQKNAKASQAIVLECAQAALQQAGILPGEVGYLEVTAAGDDATDQAEIEGLSRAYRGETPRTALGSIQTTTGNLNQVNGLAGLLRAAASLENRIRPGVPGWTGPKQEDLWQGCGFYILTSSLAWFHSDYPGNRKAAVNLIRANGNAAHLVLSGMETDSNHKTEVTLRNESPEGTRSAVRSIMRDTGQIMLQVAGESVADLATGLEALRVDIQTDASLAKIARKRFEAAQKQKASYQVAILGRSKDDVLREIDFALRGIPAAFDKGMEWQTPAGSYFTPRPLGPDSQVAFVYPGAFNSYIGVGKDLFYLFPDLYDRFTQVAADLGAAFCEDQLYPRSLAPLSKEQIDRMEASLLDDAYAMMMSGVSMSVALTMVFRDIFQVRVDSAFGYSLGENSMMFSMGVWAEGNQASLRLKHSPLFQTRLAGPQNAVREFWGLPVVKEGQMTGELWANFLLMAPAEKVMEAIQAESQVYLTHINTPRQVVIAGNPEECKRVIERLKCSALRAPFNYVLHCKAMESEFKALQEMHTWPIREVPAASLYSAAADWPFIMTDSGIAAAIAEDLCSRLDFAKLVRTVYADGARIFIELGAGSNCAKWVEEILRGQPSLSISANRKGIDDASAIFRVLARLVSHGVNLNLRPIYPV